MSREVLAPVLIFLCNPACPYNEYAPTNLFTNSRTLQKAGPDPELMFEDLCQLRGERVDRCVLYAFRCAVYFVSNDSHEAELLKWWNWKDLALYHATGAVVKFP